MFRSRRRSRVPEVGTKYAIYGLQRMLNWDVTALKGLLDLRGEKIDVREFDYKGLNEVIYEENGVTKPTRPKQVSPGVGDTFSDFRKSGKEPMPDLINQIYADFNKRNGTEVELP